MTSEIYLLAITAASIGFFHTIFGPDHYLPFIVMAKARNWKIRKTMLITFLCGLGHVLSSVVLGFIGIGLGILVGKLEIFESFRGSIAAWALISFGFVYLIWGIRKAIINKPHTHSHFHEGGLKHEHRHTHSDEHSHVHGNEKEFNITPWVLFVIFVLGPCEPLIPILMYPAAQNSVWGLIFVTTIFSVVTISTMMTVVFISSYGLSLVKLGKLERYTHVLAGFAIFTSGLAIEFLGL